MKLHHAIAAGSALTLAFAATELVAQQGIKACGLVTPAEISSLGIRSGAKPEGTTVPVKKGEGGAPTDMAMSVCAHAGSGTWDGANLTVISAKERVTEKQLNAWLDSDREAGKGNSPRGEQKVGQALCSTANVPARTDKAGATVTKIPAQYVASCSRFAGERFISIDVVQVDRSLAPKLETMSDVLEKAIARLATLK